MKNVLMFLVFIVFVGSAFGQEERLIYKKIADEYELNYNEDNFEAIFVSFSLEMQKALPFDKMKSFLSELKLQAGKIKKREFVGYEHSYASYETNFERAMLLLNISVDDNSKINGLFIKPLTEANHPKIERNKTKLLLPFKEEWTVVWGGDTKELNYHIKNKAQKNAFDFVIVNEMGQSFKTDGAMNEDYYAFGEELVAPSDGEVVLVVDGIKDNVPGVLNPLYALGNAIIIKTVGNEYLLLAHLKQHSIVVRQGQQVKQGQLLGLCGNSGNSSEPHLHFHVQNIEDVNNATGVKCYFEKVVVNGEFKSDYSPIQKDKVKNGDTR